MNTAVARLGFAATASPKRTVLLRAALGVVIVGWIGSSGARADISALPDPAWIAFLTAGGDDEEFQSPGYYTLPGSGFSGPYTASGSTSAALVATPFPSLSASAGMLTSVPGIFFPDGFESIAQLGYSIGITGPTPDVLVDVSGWAQLTEKVPDPTYSLANVTLTINGNPIVDTTIHDTANDTFFFQQSLLLPTGSEIDVVMHELDPIRGTTRG